MAVGGEGTAQGGVGGGLSCPLLTSVSAHQLLPRRGLSSALLLSPPPPMPGLLSAAAAGTASAPSVQPWPCVPRQERSGAEQEPGPPQAGGERRGLGHHKGGCPGAPKARAALSRGGRAGGRGGAPAEQETYLPWSLKAEAAGRPAG